jgi:uncharacterized protein (DUF1501 family)
MFSRRDFLKLTATGTAGALLSGPLGRAFAATPPATGENEFFIFIHAAGGWDVTLWSDPRNEKKGLVDPASTANTDTAALHHWKDQALDGDARSFALVQPPGCNHAFGPGIGNLIDLHDRLCVVNGLAMNTVSHPDGTAYSATGRHLTGSRVAASSINTVLANEVGLTQTFPSVSVQFPSSFVGDELDRRAVPLSVDRVGSIGRTLARAKQYDGDEDRASVTALLTGEAKDLATRSSYPGFLDGMALHYGALARMLASDLDEVFSDAKLRAAWPQFNYKARFQGGNALNAAFAAEAMKRNLVRCVSFALGGFDTHGNNYRTHALVQQEAFDLVAALIGILDGTPHPTKAGAKLSDHVHLLVMSDFCRTPMINLAGGRDHYPNNSALIVSPRFRGNFVFGASDKEQLLPARAKRFVDGERAIAPPDLLATFLAAFAIDPRKYMRDGEVVRELLRA